MPLQSSGAISLADIQTEFGGVNPIGIDEYYRGSSYVPGSVTAVPAGGTISLANFYGTSSVNFWALGEQDSATVVTGGEYTSGGSFTSANITATSAGTTTLTFTFNPSGATIQPATSYIRLYKNSSQIFQFTRSSGLTTTYTVSYNSGDVFYFQTELFVSSGGGAETGIIEVTIGPSLVYRYYLVNIND
jgi:hypothetical protein